KLVTLQSEDFQDLQRYVTAQENYILLDALHSEESLPTETTHNNSSGIVLDIGTGDGNFTYRMARNHPNKLFIGIDPHHQALQKISAKSSHKPQKGGVPNALFILARGEELPKELDGLANQIFINFPWAGLLSGLITADLLIWNNLRRVCQPG